MIQKSDIKIVVVLLSKTQKNDSVHFTTNFQERNQAVCVVDKAKRERDFNKDMANLLAQHSERRLHVKKIDKSQKRRFMVDLSSKRFSGI